MRHPLHPDSEPREAVRAVIAVTATLWWPHRPVTPAAPAPSWPARRLALATRRPAVRAFGFAR